MTNVNDQAAKMRDDADRAQRVADFANTLPEDKRDAFREYAAQQEAEAAPATQAVPDFAPIPGSGYPAPTSPRPAKTVAPQNANTRLADAQAGDKWDVELGCHEVPGIAGAEVQAARKALDAYEDFRHDNSRLLSDNWADIATEREAHALAEFVNEGKEPPKSRTSEVEQAMRARPLALAKARKLKADVERADAAAKDAFNRDAPGALPGIRAGVAGALDEAQAALAEFVKATSKANQLHSLWNQVRITVEQPLPSVAQSWQYTLLDGQAGVAGLDNALRNARRRVGPVKVAGDE